MDSLHFVIYIALLCTQVHLVKSCDEGWVKVDGVCYYFSKDIKLSRDAAQTRCEEMDGQLASVTTKYINDFLRYEMLQQSTGEGTAHHWIGLVGSEHSHNKQEWRWLNGQIIADMSDSWYSDNLWHDAEPSAETSVCGLIGHSDKTFGNSWCTDSFRYICETSADTGQEDWELFNGHWYFFSNQAKNFGQAMNACFRLNAYLGTIDSVEELSFVKKRTDPPENYWIGITTLHWLDGSPITWSNFKDSNVLEGKNPHVYLHTSEDKWESTNNDNLQLRFICQKELRLTNTSTTTTTTMASTTTGVRTTSISGDMTEVSEQDPTKDPSKKMIKRENDDIPMIIAIVISLAVVSSAVVITTVFLIRRKRLQNKTKENLYYNTGDNSLQANKTRNQDIVYYNAEEINTQNASHNTGYQNASYDNPDNVPSTGQDAAYQEVECGRQHLTYRNTNENVPVENKNSSHTRYQELSFDDNARHELQCAVTYQDLKSVVTNND